MSKNTLVVAVDFSDTSMAALDTAVALARDLGASITLVHAYEVPLYVYPDPALYGVGDVDLPFREAADKAMHGVVDARRGGPVPIEAVVRKGPPWEIINAVGEERDARFVVVGTHGRRGLPRMLLGSVAERVVRTSSRPVLVVHAAPKK